MPTREEVITIIIPFDTYSWDVEKAIHKMAINIGGDWFSSVKINDDGSRNVNTLIPEDKITSFKAAVFTMLATEYKIINASIKGE